MIKLKFSKPDKHGQAHANMAADLLIKKEVAYFDIKIDGTGELARYRMDYKDAGTIKHSAAKGQYAVNGRMVNVSRDWANGELNGFEIIHVIGVIDNGKARLHLWVNK